MMTVVCLPDDYTHLSRSLDFFFSLSILPYKMVAICPVIVVDGVCV